MTTIQQNKIKIKTRSKTCAVPGQRKIFDFKLTGQGIPSEKNL